MRRRTFLLGCAGLAVGLAGGRPLAASGLPAATRRLLDGSEFVYVSPLHPDGRESTCHGEVWYGWLDDAVYLITARTTWKHRALERGSDRARIWVGNHGRWKGFFGNNEDFRAAPHFDARASAVRDDAMLERLLALYEGKYPDEIADWRERMRNGYADGTRALIRYAPL